MKIYRTPFFRSKASIYFWTLLVVVILVAPLLVESWQANIERGVSSDYLRSLFTWCGSLLLIVLLFGSIMSSFYIRTDKDKIVIQNGILSWWRKTHRWSEIASCELRSSGYKVRLIVQERGGRRTHTVVDLVGRREYPRLIAEIDLRGISIKS